MTAYYNEINPYAAQWLRNLIAAGHIAPGEVDERSIEDVRPDDLREFTQCHFFAGIGVWSYALRQAGWPDDRPVWTGSCPCQPFSQAGDGVGFADERHLWPAFDWLIGQRRPPVIFGEQVASKAVGPWIDLVHADVEALGYAFGAVAFPSAGVGAPHIRDRLFWVADACGPGPQEQFGRWFKPEGFTTHGATLRMADANSERLHGFDSLLQWEKSRRITGDRVETDGCGPVNGFWRGADWISCRDDRWRSVEPGSFPLVNGAPSRMGRLRADWRSSAGKEASGWRVGRLRCYGNAINAEAAKTFIEAYLDAQN